MTYRLRRELIIQAARQSGLPLENPRAPAPRIARPAPRVAEKPRPPRPAARRPAAPRPARQAGTARAGGADWERRQARLRELAQRKRAESLRLQREFDRRRERARERASRWTR